MNPTVLVAFIGICGTLAGALSSQFVALFNARKDREKEHLDRVRLEAIDMMRVAHELRLMTQRDVYGTSPTLDLPVDEGRHDQLFADLNTSIVPLLIEPNCQQITSAAETFWKTCPTATRGTITHSAGKQLMTNQAADEHLRAIDEAYQALEGASQLHFRHQ